MVNGLLFHMTQAAMLGARKPLAAPRVKLSSALTH